MACTSTNPPMYFSSSTSTLPSSLLLPSTTTTPTVVRQGSFVGSQPLLSPSPPTIVVSAPTTISYAAPCAAPRPVVSAAPVARLAIGAAPTPVVASASVVAPKPVVAAVKPVVGERLYSGRSFTLPAPRKMTEGEMRITCRSFTLPPPRKMTEGFPDPDTIAKQREGYAKSLDLQLKEGTDAVVAQGKAQKDMIEQNGKLQLAEYQLQVEAQMKMSSVHVDQQVQSIVMALQEAALQQKTLLEEKAAYAIRDYEKRKALDEVSTRAYQLRKEYFEGELKLLDDLQKAKAKT
eukprot:CAMPEP_0169104060 /NCGR_PEP_ID=MMETSP1015-20121227/23053_1 /TAXON_ID=342587 /ORGANISM="Karlodinium micrum, Strain CCMP2283" /LENGTH=290 /DNA_ID=CAMNT_0009165311 /DNA_START=39 /DNA_END=911 /DNA_ORIENTATION=+